MQLCNPMDCSMPGFPVLHCLPEFVKTPVHWIRMVPSNHLILCPSLLLLFLSFPASGSFLMSRLFVSRGQNIGTSASIKVLPFNIQGWFPLGLTGLISLQSKGLSRVFSTPQFKASNFRDQLLYSCTFTSMHDYWKNHSFDYTDVYQQIDISAF